MWGIPQNKRKLSSQESLWVHSTCTCICVTEVLLKNESLKTGVSISDYQFVNYDWGKLCKRSQVPVFFRQQLSCRIPLLAIKCSLFSPPSKLHVLMLHMTIICFFLLCPYIFNTICNTKSVHHVNILYAFDARLTR